MKIGLITTLDTNIGDDFIREGICLLLAEAFKGASIHFIAVNKHLPYTVYPAWHPLQMRKLAEKLPVGQKLLRSTAETLFPKIGLSRFDDCDLIVQCGAPVFWPYCSQNEWARPLWHEVVGRLSRKIPILNLAAGSCYPWERQPTIVDIPADRDYIHAILGYCCLTTVRDRLSQAICNSLKKETRLLPCTALLAARAYKARRTISEGNILINYMAGSGHFMWEQGIDHGNWETTVKTLVKRLAKRHRIALLCHDEHEFSLAKDLAPGLTVFFPRTSREYFETVSAAKFAICNRMHASIGMAGLGIPSIAVGTDTRLLMVAETGLRIHYVKDATADLLEEETEISLKSLVGEQERLISLRESTRESYLSLIKETLSLL